ncbi:hypothetical protein N802_15510 [Knoellia sinensis KCTC 19936]|uniref:Lipoprotein n=1 Tax=Knoellia sinensis KCTC 19936 TaxID=1385520 RepID=A0A0A0J8G5_9MICO|nr:hypothetical protein [Knoellia sinensis]KGN32999.1 hypothetical protein N802_15510 [Knoellia sinensis KCTC 19936]
MTKGHLVKAVKARTTAIALAGVLALSACSGTTSAQTAAVVEGRVITEQQVSEATDQLNKALKPDPALTPARTLNYLILAPYAIDAAASAGQPVSESAARATPAFQALGEAPAASTIEVFRADASLQQLDEASGQSLTKQIAGLDVTVNPRYGRFDTRELGLVQDQPNWLIPTAPAADAPAQ